MVKFIIYGSLGCLLLSFYSNTISAQDQDTLKYKMNIIYAEAWGNAKYTGYSLNYERVCYRNFSFRIGVGCDRFNFNFPILVNFVSNLREENHFEFGIGTVLDFLRPGTSIYYPPYFRSALTGSLMYRYQKPLGKIIFKAGWTPVYFFNSRHFNARVIGISAGYSF